jgi:hypothetical protein
VEVINRELPRRKLLLLQQRGSLFTVEEVV